MVIQLPLPAVWAQLETRRDQLAELRADTRKAKAKIRATLDELAERHGIPAKDVTYAMGYVDDMLADVTYDFECELQRGVEREERCDE